MPSGGALATWADSGTKLLRTARLEAARSGHTAVQPAHLLLAALDQPEVHQALRAIGQRPDVYAVRARLVAANLAPVDFDEDAPVGVAAEAMLESVRARREEDPTGVLFLLLLKATLQDDACRILTRRARLDPGLLDAALGRLD
jgi:hypothetical protein